MGIGSFWYGRYRCCLLLTHQAIPFAFVVEEGEDGGVQVKEDDEGEEKENNRRERRGRLVMVEGVERRVVDSRKILEWSIIMEPNIDYD